MEEHIEKSARLLASQWNKLPLAGTCALESLLMTRIEEFSDKEDRKSFLLRVRELASDFLENSGDAVIKPQSYRRLNSAIEGLLGRL